MEGTAKHKHKSHKKASPALPPPADVPSSTPDPAPVQTVRGTVTQLFSSTTPITIPNSGDTAGGGVQGSAADPYPSTIEASGFTNGVITDVKVHLNNLT